jgi:uncharacterized membrane protein YphA (DoxX/SURF4 family)
MILSAARLSNDPGSQSARLHPSAGRDRSLDIALFILRAAALLVIGTWGWAKLHGLINIVHLGRPLANSGFVRLVRQLGFPLPRFMAVCAIINESVVASLVFWGIVTRPAALVASLGNAGAWYSSLVLGEESLRAALCTLIFATLAFCGAGKYSADHVLWPRKASSSAWGEDLGLLLLRIGIAVASMALAIVPRAKDSTTPSLLDGKWHNVQCIRRWMMDTKAQLESWIDGNLIAHQVIPILRADSPRPAKTWKFAREIRS